MKKIDFKKTLKELYSAPSKEPVIIDVPMMNFLMIDGQGDPDSSQEFQEAIQTLYGMSFTAKFMFKGNPAFPDYVVPPLEGLWHRKDIEEFDLNKKNKWKWTLMIMQPKWFTKEVYEQTKKSLKKKKNPPALSKLRFESIHEGKAVQIIHVGQYDLEPVTLKKLYAYINDQELKPKGRHHEVYLSDPRRCKPNRLRTILRQAVE